MMAVDKTNGNLPGRQFRFDRNFVNSICVTAARTEADRKLCWYIMLHVASTYQSDIFNSGIFDVDQFCKEWGFSRQNLAKRHDDPYQKEDMKDAQEEFKLLQENYSSQHWNEELAADKYFWRSVIENALYILLSTTVSFPNGKGGAFLDPDFIEVSKGGAKEQVFTELYCVTNNKGKMVYCYRLNERFVQNFNNYFVSLNVESLKALRRKGLEDLYIYLIGVRNSVYSKGKTATDVSYTPGFEKLCDFAQVPKVSSKGKDYEFKERKRLLNSALDYIRNCASDLKYTIEWVCGDGSVKDVPLFDFGMDELERIRDGERTIWWKIFGEELLRKYSHIYSELRNIPIRKLSEQMVIDWLRDRSDNWSLKMSTFEVIYMDVFKKPKGSSGISDMFLKFIGYLDGGYSVLKIYPDLYPGTVLVS